jgi:hypothetical protein
MAHWATRDFGIDISRANWPKVPTHRLGTSEVTKLERLRQEREQVSHLLESARLSADTRHVLEALARDLDHQIDEELTSLLSPGHKSSEGSSAA